MSIREFGLGQGNDVINSLRCARAEQAVPADFQAAAPGAKSECAVRRQDNRLAEGLRCGGHQQIFYAAKYTWDAIAIQLEALYENLRRDAIG